MPSSNQELKTLLAQGKLEQTLDTLVRHTKHAGDADLRQRALTLSGQFAALKKQHLSGLLDEKDYRLQWNRILAAVTDIADNQQLSESWKLSESSSQRQMNWEKWALALGIFAAIAGITGYALRDFWQKKDPSPLVQPAAEPPKKDTIVVTTPPENKFEEKPAGGKNNVNIKVQDKAKVGNINTGDSNVYHIKQDF